MPRYGYLLVFLVPSLMPLAYVLGDLSDYPNLFAFFPLIVLDGILPLIDQWVGRDPRNPEEKSDNSPDRTPIDRFYDLAVLACLPVFVVLLLWAGHVLFTLAPFSIMGAIGWTISLGYIGGIIAINAAHELIHRRSLALRAAGGTLLSLVSYSGFKVEHVRGHHVHVSTPEDASSAPKGMSVYRFLPRALYRNTLNAWKLESVRLRDLGLPVTHWRNELIGWHLLTAVLAMLHVGAYGLAGLAFFLGQSLVAVVSLEIINYVEHYGLRRRKLSNGRYQRPDITHSWNSCHRVSNLMLFNLARHSDHHAHPTRPYPMLKHDETSPQLPAGYSAMYLLAGVPPLWRHIMDPLVEHYESRRL